VTINSTHWILTLVCEDRPGIVHAISGAIVDSGGNITESQQFASDDTGSFFMRLQVESTASRDGFEAALAPVTERYEMTWQLDVVGRPLRTLILVSKAGHCLNDVLYRQRAGQLSVEIPLVLSNHPDLEGLAKFYDVPFESHPVTTAGQKLSFEDRVLEVVEKHDIELVVLARYMQILSPELCAALSGRIINIHHSFLPGFKGANPYKQAHARGVKLIGATAHFVTSDLASITHARPLSLLPSVKTKRAAPSLKPSNGSLKTEFFSTVRAPLFSARHQLPQGINFRDARCSATNGNLSAVAVRLTPSTMQNGSTP
jgi:formyltetrahydrofolate deformylase